MVLQAKKHYTVEEFDVFVMLPENVDKLFEFVGGEIVEMVSNNYSSEIAATILILLGMFVKTHKLGRVTGADGGYIVAGQRYIPDVAYISAQKQPQPSHEPYNPNAPDLAVEVLSPTDSPAMIRIKIVNYLRAGTTLWVVDPEEKQVEVYIPGQAPQTAGVDDTLDGGALLPGFTLRVRDIFAEEAPLAE